VQSRGVDIASDPLPPAAPNDVGDPLTDTWHFDDVGAVTEVSEDVQAKATSAATAAKESAARASITRFGCTRLASRTRKIFSQD